MHSLLASGLTSLGKSLFDQAVTKQVDKPVKGEGDFQSFLQRTNGGLSFENKGSLDVVRSELKATLMQLANDPDFTSFAGGLLSGQGVHIQTDSNGQFQLCLQDGRTLNVAEGSTLHGIVERVQHLRNREQSLGASLTGNMSLGQVKNGTYVTLP